MQRLGFAILLDSLVVSVELLLGPTPQNQPLGALVQPIFADYGLLAMSRNHGPMNLTSGKGFGSVLLSRMVRTP